MQVRPVPDQVFPVSTLPNAALGLGQAAGAAAFDTRNRARKPRPDQAPARSVIVVAGRQSPQAMQVLRQDHPGNGCEGPFEARAPERSEEHTSELQSLMRISYAVFCLKKQKHTRLLDHTTIISFTYER